jgi:hypothetical protein
MDPLTASQTALASALISASVTFWAIYMALYTFVFKYFTAKPELERIKRGMAYYNFFGSTNSISIFTGVVILSSIVALAFENVTILFIATLFFGALLIFGTYFVFREVLTSQEFVEPYARVDVFGKTTDKALRRLLRHELLERMSKEEKDEAIRKAIEDAMSEGDKAVKKVFD